MTRPTYLPLFCLCLSPLLVARNLPIAFEPNRGQAPSDVRYLARAAGYAVSLSPGSIKVQSSAGAFRMRFPGANRRARLEALEPLAGTANYFLGGDSSQWRTGIPTFGQVRYRNLYPHIDLILHSSAEGRVEYDFRIAPGGDPRAVRLAFDGARPVRIDAEGNLVLAGKGGEWIEHRPRLFQDGAPVAGGYRLLANGEAAFRVGRYDRARTLIVDPAISYATFLGPNAFESVAVDSQGNAYVAGFSVPLMCPNPTGCGNAILNKINPAGTALIYSAVLGTSGLSYAQGVAVDAAGNAYVTGATNSASFPVTSGALLTSLPSDGDGFLTKLDPTGSTLLYSTFLGGAFPNLAANTLSTVLAPTGDLYVAGTTLSSTFPVLNAFQSNSGGDVCGYGPQSPVSEPTPLPCPDAFVMHWRASDMTLLFSTYLGGSGGDGASAVAADSAGNVYVTGSTSSADFPVMNAFQSTLAPGTCQSGGFGPSGPCPDAFVTKIAPDGTLVYSTYLGGNGVDAPTGIATDSAGEAYVAGETVSTNFPTVNAFQTVPGFSFIAKFNAAGNALVFSTYFNGGDGPGPLATDSAGDAFLFATGSQFLGNVDVAFIPSQVNPCAGGPFNNLVPLLMEFRPDGSLAYAGLFGGTSNLDQVSGIQVDTAGNIYVVGGTTSGDFPVTAGAYQAAYGQAPFGNGFLAKIGAAAPPTGISLASACIVNSGSFQNLEILPDPSGARSGFVSPGEIVTIFGSGLGPAEAAYATIDSQGGIATSLAGVTLTFDGSPAPLLYVQSNQVNAVVPFEIAGKTSTVVELQYDGAASNPAIMLVSDAVPGIYTAPVDGQIQIAAFNQDGTLNSPANPAVQGSVVSMWATGLGLPESSYADGQIVTGPGSLGNPPEIGFASEGLVLQTEYMGPAPGFVAGAMQINIVIPVGAPPGLSQVQFNTSGFSPYSVIYVK